MTVDEIEEIIIFSDAIFVDSATALIDITEKYVSEKINVKEAEKQYGDVRLAFKLKMFSILKENLLPEKDH